MVYLTVRGTCRVMCFHPKSNLTIPLMTKDEIVNIIQEWIKEFNELGQRYTWVQVINIKYIL